MAKITGYGAVSAVGIGMRALWTAMAEGANGIGSIRRFDTANVGSGIAGMVPQYNEPMDGPMWRVCVEMGIAAAREAWQHANLDRIRPDRIAFVFGSSIGDRKVGIDVVTEAVANALGITGPRFAISTACTSSTNAIGIGLDLLEIDAADAVIAGGADALSPLVVAGFTALGVLSPSKCAPFSEPVGTSLGEGAGFVVLERTGKPVFALRGYGLSADAFHETGPDPTGSGVARAMRAALDHAGVSTTNVDYINAHGTGTAQNDPAEWRAIQQVFGERADNLPVSSSKSFLGHAQGAAGVLETLSTLAAMEHGAIPPTQNFTVPRQHGPRDVVAQQTARPAHCDVAISTSSAFGGANCALVVARDGSEAPRPRRRVTVAGCGLLGGRGRVPTFSLRDFAPAADPRGLDPSTKYLLASVGMALDDAGVRIRGELRDRAGLILGITQQSPESDDALYKTIDERGHRGLSAHLFARQVLNAPAGSCAKAFSLRGAHSTICAGETTGLLAMIYAAELTATRNECELVLGVGVDELPATGALPDDAEGAACLALRPGSGPVELAGWSVAGPGHLDEACARALAMAKLDGVDLVIDAAAARERYGRSPAFTSASGAVLATRLIREGRAKHIMVTRAGGTACDAALIVVEGERV